MHIAMPVIGEPVAPGGREVNREIQEWVEVGHFGLLSIAAAIFADRNPRLPVCTHPNG